MKKSVIFAAATTLIMLSGCSADEEAVNASEDLAIEGYSNVEIKLSSNNGTGVSATRAAFMGDEEKIEGLGIFGLAREQQDINQQPLPVNWFDTSENWSGCILDNVKATMTLDEETGTKYKIALEGAPYFYPISQFYSYDFYGYYPHSTNVTKGTNTVSTTIDIDGETDVLWGRATSTEKYAYSAKYFRANENAPLPSITLQHMLARFVFYVVPGADTDGGSNYDEALKMQIDEVEISDTYGQMSLLIADHNQLNMAVEDRTTPLGEKNKVVALAMEGPVSPLLEDGAPAKTQIGESLMLYPQDRYTIRIKASRDGVEFPTEFPLYMALGDPFERGKSYNVTITLHGPKEIELEATLEDWEEVDGPTIEL